MNSDPVERQRCRRCSAPMSAQDQFCQECGAAVASAKGQTCRACGTALGPAARFCPRCGAPVRAARGTDLRAGWDRVRTRAATVDWVRVGRVIAPVAALLIAGLVGYALGHRTEATPSSADHVVSAARGWRSGASPTGGHGGPGERGRGLETGLPTGTGPERPPAAAPAPSSPLLRFRDFRVSASSYELANPPSHAADGDPYTAWHAWETERFADGDWLTLTFPKPRLISRIGLIPGRIGPQSGEDGRVRSILVKAPGAAPQKLIFTGRPEMQYRDLKQPVLARTLTLRIVTVLPGRRSRHIIIPEVQVWGRPAANQMARRPGG